MKNLITAGSIVLGILFIIVAIVYFVTPANALPHFIPGYNAALLRHHTTHAIASLFLGLGSFAFAWFHSGGDLKSKNNGQNSSNGNTVESERK